MPLRTVVPLVLLMMCGAFAVGRLSASRVEEPPPPPPAPVAAKTVLCPPCTAAECPVAPFTTVTLLDGGVVTVERTARPRREKLPALDVLEPEDCLPQLTALQARVKAEKEERQVNEGTPLAQPTPQLDTRFTGDALKSSLSLAFTQSRVPGGVSGVDCSEYPCLVHGRIRGSEDFMERLERAKAFAAYEDDIMVAMLWTVTDEAERPAATAQGTPDRVEQTLFTIALYPRSDRARIGDALDRRLKTRTFALWNTQSPFDETGH